MTEIIKALDILCTKQTIPYHLIRDLKLEFKDNDEFGLIKRGAFLNQILSHSQCKEIFLRLIHHKGLLNLIIPSLVKLERIPQRKHKSKNVFEHTVNVIEQVPFDNNVLRWVALLHDTGKYDSYNKNKNFKKHELYSVNKAKLILSNYRIPDSDKILSVIKHHMYPFNYQKDPTWKDKSVIKFIDTCGEENIYDIIEFSIYDKLAETHKNEFIAPLQELRDRVRGILNGQTSNRDQISRSSASV